MQCVSPFYLTSLKIEVPCGHCGPCRSRKVSEWAIRLSHELQFHSGAIFVTLTYDPENLPRFSSLKDNDVVKFIKRLRYYLPEKTLKFFRCGEYGNRGTLRPHYHLIIFGLTFPECKPQQYRRNRYTSKLLSDTWSNGFIDVSPVSYAKMKYVAGYTNKKLYGKLSIEHYEERGLLPPYCVASKGIGKAFALQHSSKIKSDLHFTIHDGIKVGVPRYYRKLLNITYEDYKSYIEESNSKFFSDYTSVTGYYPTLMGPAINLQYKLGFDHFRFESQSRHFSAIPITSKCWKYVYARRAQDKARHKFLEILSNSRSQL